MRVGKSGVDLQVHSDDGQQREVLSQKKSRKRTKSRELESSEDEFHPSLQAKRPKFTTNYNLISDASQIEQRAEILVQKRPKSLPSNPIQEEIEKDTSKTSLKSKPVPEKRYNREDINRRQSGLLDALGGKTTDLPKPGRRRLMQKFPQKLAENVLTPVEKPRLMQKGTSKSGESYSNLSAPKLTRPTRPINKKQRYKIENALSSKVKRLEVRIKPSLCVKAGLIVKRKAYQKGNLSLRQYLATL